MVAPETKAQRVERLKRKLNPWEAYAEIVRFAREGWDTIPPEWRRGQGDAPPHGPHPNPERPAAGTDWPATVVGTRLAWFGEHALPIGAVR